MKAIIDKDGYLEILRGSTIKPQRCPFTTIPDIRPDGDGAVFTDKIRTIDCGDWCPLFGEPLDCGTGEIQLQLCHNTLTFTEITDEREKDKDQD